MRIGYIRVSTDKQNTERQREALAQHNPDKVFEEKISGKTKERPKLKELLDFARPGDTIFIESYSRLARNTRDLISLVEEFNKREINLVSIKENTDTSTPTGKLIFTIFAGLAEFERDLILERTSEGRAQARKRGITGGRPVVDQEKIARALQLYDEKVLSIRDICLLAGVSRATLYNYLNKRAKNTL